MSIIGERIKEKRRQAGLTQGQLGEIVGLSATAIMRYERNEREPRYDTLRQLASALGTTVSYLFGIDESSDGGHAFAQAINGEKELSEVETELDVQQKSMLESLLQPIYADAIAMRAEQLRKDGGNIRKPILDSETLRKQIAAAEQDHITLLESICFDRQVLPEDYPERIRYVTAYLDEYSGYLKTKMPGTHLPLDDIEEAEKIRAAGVMPAAQSKQNR